MLRATLAILVLVLSIGMADDGGGGAAVRQPPSGFSGHWVLSSRSPERPGYDEFWVGTEATVVQDALGLVITRLNPPPQREAKFAFGKESRNEYSVKDQRIIRDSRASLGAGLLLISTDTTDASGQRWLSNISRWSLDSDGALVIGDTEICGRGECPSVITTLKFTRKR